MATKKVTVTSASVGTGDTLASYNVYSSHPSAKTLLGTMTPAEASAGKNFTLSDGNNHSITVYPVGTNTGESNTPSNAVVVDLTVSAFDWSAFEFALQPTANPSNSAQSLPQDLSGNDNHGLATTGAGLPALTGGKSVFTTAGENAFQLTNAVTLGQEFTEIIAITIDDLSPATTTPFTAPLTGSSDWLGVKSDGKLHFSIFTQTFGGTINYSDHITEGVQFLMTIIRNTTTVTFQFNDDTPITLTGYAPTSSRTLQVIGASPDLTRWNDFKIDGYAAINSILTGTALANAKAAVLAL